MKRIFTSAVVLLGTTIAYAQYEGRVGINTETPAATIDIKSKTGTTSATKNLELQNASGTKLVTVLDDGKVGIGTANPSQKLEVVGNILANKGGLFSTNSNNEGGFLELANTKKTDRDISRWRIFNMTGDDEGGYKKGLHFWAYAADGTNLYSRMVITDDGNVGIGNEVTRKGYTNLKERLEVDGNIRSTNLSGTGDRPVFADENGVLKTGSFAMKATSTTEACSETNEGSIHYKTIDKDGKKVGVFGFCTRDINGNFVWSYRVGENSIFSGTGAFASGL